jgi:glycyl-tRNA synthetase beta chain
VITNVSLLSVPNSPVGPMRTGELLLELLSEEIPARMQRRAIEDLCGLLRDKLAAAKIPATSLRGYVAPRRLAIIAEGVPLAQPDRTEERRGPRVGAPQPAIEGFLRSLGLAAIGECEIRNTDRGEFYFAVVTRTGRPAAEVLSELIRAVMVELPWPKSMRYPASSLRWVRPLTSVLCLFDGDVLPLPLDRIPVGRMTRGHRFLAPDEICVGGAADYLARLQDARVILDQDRRKEMIQLELDRLAAAEGLAVRPDPALLDEVTGLVEFPIVLMGGIDTSFQTLPPEVLATAMRTHQKYFACIAPDGRLAPHFLFVANTVAADDGKTIVAGNERVLQARLSDARFFWDQDCNVRLEDRVGALSQRVFHAALHVRAASVREKVRRMELLANLLAPQVGANTELARRAVLLCKADLSTGIVGEFPELQGIMGHYYALNDGENRLVADAIAEHYKPLGPQDSCPTAPVSVVVALADKIDTLVALFATGDRPTGSRDPFGLRRAALGLIRLILENTLRLPLAEAFEIAAKALYPDFRSPPPPGATLVERARLPWQEQLPAIPAEVLTFIAERLKVHLREQGVRHDLIAAVFAKAGEAEDDLVRLLAWVAALRAFLASEDGTNLLIAHRRASNIVAIEEKRDRRRYDGEVDQALLRQPEEQALFDELADVGDRAGTLLAREEFDKAMSEFARLRRPVDDFFDKITVNTEEPRLRENRLRLLSSIRETMNQVADFSQIEG